MENELLDTPRLKERNCLSLEARADGESKLSMSMGTCCKSHSTTTRRIFPSDNGMTCSKCAIGGACDAVAVVVKGSCSGIGTVAVDDEEKDEPVAEKVLLGKECVIEDIPDGAELGGKGRVKVDEWLGMD